MCRGLAEGETPVEIGTAAAGWAVGEAAASMAEAGTSAALRRAHIARPVIGAEISSIELRMAMRGRRAGLVGAAVGLGVGYFFW